MVQLDDHHYRFSAKRCDCTSRPAASWGNLLAQAQDVQNLARYPWILIPGIFIFLAVMSFNFLGDHLDPATAG
jgi:ABC-type dipeptide/oligopeptide/nickel transport system permease subunit